MKFFLNLTYRLKTAYKKHGIKPPSHYLKVLFFKSYPQNDKYKKTEYFTDNSRSIKLSKLFKGAVIVI